MDVYRHFVCVDKPSDAVILINAILLCCHAFIFCEVIQAENN